MNKDRLELIKTILGLLTSITGLLACAIALYLLIKYGINVLPIPIGAL